MIAYGLLSVVDGGCWWCLLLVLDVGCSSSNRIIFNDSVTTPSTSFALRHWQGDSGRRGECSTRRRQLGRMAGSQKPFVRLVASALRCKNNCIKWPRTATGLERFSSAAWERRGKRERVREEEKESCSNLLARLCYNFVLPGSSCLPFGQQQEENQFAACCRCNCHEMELGLLYRH